MPRTGRCGCGRSRRTTCGRVGDDEYGRHLRADLTAAGVAGVLVDPTEPSGPALILVDAAGENMIAVSPRR
ncbi:PfkB family carbohydrate kinase [Micromonospora sp. NPDC006431]|uniref:PfkB family carbohydrate kinase n=1 Tax=Micromonospora sp. NPDC006431 TaxID=3364235 RepID=UPI0036BF8E1D